MKISITALIVALALASCGAAPAYAAGGSRLIAATPECVTLDGVKQINAAARPEYLPIDDIQFKVLKSALVKENAPIPDEVVSVVLAHTDAAPGVVFVFGFDKDGCSKGSGQLPESFVRHVFGTTDS